MKALTNAELNQRAKALYFDKNKEIKEMFVDEYGRFSYTPENLVELNKGSKVKVMKITRDKVSDINTSKVNDLSTDKAIDKNFPGKEKKETAIPKGSNS